MIPLPTARRRAEELEAALAPRSSSTVPDDLGPLLDVVAALRAEAAAAPATPRPAFSAALRERLMTEADTVLVPVDPADEQRLTLPRTNAAPRRQRRVAVVAAAAVISGASTTMAYAAQDALPGDSLYSVKRALEGARDSISLTDAAQGTVTLRHAEQRLAELQGLVERDDVASAARVPSTLDSFVEQADRGSALLLGDAGDNDRVAQQVRTFVAESVATLAAVEPSLDAEDRSALGRAISVLTAIDERALDLCPTCGSGAAVSLPFELSSAADLWDSGLSGDLPELPTFDGAAELPPGSVSGGVPTAPLEVPGATPQTPTAPGATPQAPESGTPSTPPAAPTTPSTPAPAVPTPPAIVPPGGVSGLTDPITGATGPLAGPLRGVTDAIDKLLGLDQTP